MAEPQRLHQEPEAVEKVIATGVSIVVGLTNDRQITFQTGFEGDEEDAAINRRFDRIMRLADRQKAKYSMKEAVKELAQREKALANFIFDKAVIESRHDREQAMRRETIDEMMRLRSESKAKCQSEIDGTILKIQEKKAGIVEDAQAAYRRSGKLGAFKLVGVAERNAAACDQALATAAEHRNLALAQFDDDYDAKIAEVEAEITRVQADRDQHATNLEETLKRHYEGVEATRADLNELQELAEG